MQVSHGERRKLSLLKDAAGLFLDIIRRDAEDQLSVVQFSGDAEGIFGALGALTPLTTGSVGDAQLEINEIFANGETDIRTGLEIALMKLPALAPGVEDADRRRVIIFFSDGKKTDGGDPADGTFLDLFPQQDVHIYSVGFGNRGRGGRSGIDAELLTTLAAAGSGGFTHVADIDGELKQFFTQAVATAINGYRVLCEDFARQLRIEWGRSEHRVLCVVCGARCRLCRSARTASAVLARTSIAPRRSAHDRTGRLLIQGRPPKIV